jgi:hypothetical protein
MQRHLVGETYSGSLGERLSEQLAGCVIERPGADVGCIGDVERSVHDDRR